MKERGKKRNILKNICTLVIVFVLVCCSVSTFTIATVDMGKEDNNLNTTFNTPQPAQALGSGDRLLLDENFTDGNMPPTGDHGDWDLHQTNPDQTWYIDTTAPHTKSNCATVHRDDSDELQDEWLITPSLNFSEYEEINLTFYWYSCFYVTLWKQYIEFNISVSTDEGGNWTNIWRFNDLDLSFTDWKWYKSEPIDLSAFAGENDVRIAFQYYSNTTTAAEQQEFSIDDILVKARGVGGLACDAGGPYNWYWNRQLEYWPLPGVRFHGSFVNGSLTGTQLLWDFGDGNTSLSLPLNTDPVHFYHDIGTFNVTLTAIDNSVTPPMIAESETTITLFLLAPPELDIELQEISLGIKGDIVNDGDYDATYVNWTMNVSWGPFQIFQMFEKNVGNGTIENIAAGTSETVRSSLYFFGFGRISIEFTAYPENLPGVIRNFKGIKIGPFVIITSEVINP
ncbi:MAG: PKD domain-containing protein [Candidatus Thermoplasmatota archaeon]